MSNSHNAPLHARQSPPHVRKTATKAARPVLSSRTASTPKITIRGAKAIKRAKQEEEEILDDDDDDMGSSFLQFCAMCEKQIVVPNSSILYCSESCRRRDAEIPTTHPYLLALGSPTKMLPSSFSDDIDDPFGSKIPTYVPAMRPTPRTLPEGRIPPMLHDGKSDLDPTEWKPAETTITEGNSPTKSGEWKPKLPHRPSSEASSFLSKFHRSSDSLASKRRPMIGHGRSTLSNRATPSLSHTPTASTSSEESLAGTPYEFVVRPALSMPSTFAAQVSEGIDVTKDRDDLIYEKKHVGTSLGSASGRLKKLLGTASSM